MYAVQKRATTTKICAMRACNVLGLSLILPGTPSALPEPISGLDTQFFSNLVWMN
jgi:hypothetical protein